ncbi:hypothetical protein KUM02_004630 [Vibrio parahaemolyticus]|uniref:hypothetical protein n=1 Tax=Vibrio sp. Vb2201 TaxID=3074655 RepID=UPI001DA1C72C|nr:hypothetical protein [Vibrio sp. Vb2201]EHR5466080.1 hypothetical protein [Vibrio parahaemolyticus]EIO2938103.1 hypothetical protein [Vibrio parahaemolyticus]MDW1798946.1 hypothetical protein [Vibrio sp. Vb2201]
MATIKPEVLAQLNPNVILYPCKYFGNGILPLPITKGYAVEEGETIARTKMDLGLSTMRERARVTPTEYTFTFRFTGEQVEVFRSWVFNEIDKGKEWFYLPLRTGDYDLEVHKCQLTVTPGTKSAPFKWVRGGKGFSSIWELKVKVQTFRANRLERYTARVLSRDTLSGIEKAAQAADNVLLKLP